MTRTGQRLSDGVGFDRRSREVRESVRRLLLGGSILIGLLGPANARPDDVRDPLLVEAWNEFRAGRNQEAAARFQAAATLHPDKSAASLQAWYGYALAMQHSQPWPRPEEAERALRRIIDADPRGPLAPWAILELGNLANDRTRQANPVAAVHFERVLSEFAESPAADEAALKLAGITIAEGTRESVLRGVGVLEARLARYPDNPVAVVMHLRLDYTYCVILQDYANSLRHAEAVCRLRLKDPFRWSRQLWHTAELHRRFSGDRERAAHFYRLILTEAPRSEHAWAARQRLGEWGMLEGTGARNGGKHAQ
jgi:tetratricopeptide (TPR) repeat protein